MNIFEHTINEWTFSILKTEYKNEDWDSSELIGLIEQPPNPELGDYALPCFSFSKFLRRSPAVIASELADKFQEHLLQNALFTHIQARGPYLNFTVSAAAVAKSVLPNIFYGDYFKEPSSIKREKVMIEYSQPNTHKGFHVGHLRNVALGDSLCRIYLYNGYDVVGANYIGDIGSHIAKCLWYLKNHNTEDPPENYPGEWLGELYANAIRKLENAEGQEKISFQDELSQLLRKLDEKDEEIYREWETTREWSMKDFHEIYEWLDVKFDHFFYESEVDEEGRQIVIEGEKKGIFKKSEGAIGIDLEEEGLGFFMLLKSDGNTLYSTKDLALARQKI